MDWLCVYVTNIRLCLSLFHSWSWHIVTCQMFLSLSIFDVPLSMHIVMTVILTEYTVSILTDVHHVRLFASLMFCYVVFLLFSEG